MKKEIDPDSKEAIERVQKILAYGDRASKSKLIASLIYLEKVDFIEEIKERWGEEEFYKIVEYC